MVVLRSAERQVGAHLRQPDAAEQLAIRREYEDAGVSERRIRTAPHIAERIGAHPVRTALHAIDLHVSEHALAAELRDGAGVHLAG